MNADDESLSFPDEPRGQLDTAIAELVRQAGEVLETQGRLRALLRANHAVVENLALPVVLRRIAEAAVELVGAQYGALGVVSPSGGLEEFIHVGMASGSVKEIGHLPEGHGILGALIDDPRPIRLEHLSADSRSVGFPAHHPPMDNFLGVPIRVRDEVFGNLYLTNRAGGTFSAEDEQLVGSLAATAGFAIENARLFAETERRRAWAAASAEVTAAMLSTDQDDALSILADRVLEIADADLVCVVISSGTEVAVTTARGVDAEALTGQRFPAHGTLAGSVLEGGQPLLVADGSESIVPLTSGEILGPVMALPINGQDATEGVLIVGRLDGGARFSPADLEMSADFAGQASIALELVKTKKAQQALALADDRGRIARDLHDHVIQQLFGAGLELNSVAGALGSAPLATRVRDTASRLDDAIAQIRTAIFALTPVPGEAPDSIRHDLIDLVAEYVPAFASSPAITFAGPVDLAVDAQLAQDVLAVAREALTNAAKHANASAASLSLRVTDDDLIIEVSDNGDGISGARRSGLANLQERAERRHGTCTVTSGQTGTVVRWSVPLASA